METEHDKLEEIWKLAQDAAKCEHPTSNSVSNALKRYADFIKNVSKEIDLKDKYIGILESTVIRLSIIATKCNN